MMRCHTTWTAAAHGAAALKCQVEVPGGSATRKLEDTTSWVELPRAQKMLHGSATWKPYQDISEEEDLPNLRQN